MKVVSFCSFKGGVGKTTLISNIAMQLAIWGKKVLLVDLDPQSNLSVALLGIDKFVDEVKNKKTIIELFHDVDDLDQYIIKPKLINQNVSSFNSLSKVHIIVSNLELMLLQEKSISKINWLHRCLEKVKDNYDIVMIDCPPSMNFLTKSALMASNCYVVPTTPDFISILGIQITQKFVDEFNTSYDFNVPLLGVIFNRVKIYGGVPVSKHKDNINMVSASNIPIFMNYLSDSPGAFADFYETGVPVFINSADRASNMKNILENLTKEFASKLWGEDYLL